jgi:hypothetical protein
MIILIIIFKNDNFYKKIAFSFDDLVTRKILKIRGFMFLNKLDFYLSY